LDVPKEQVTAQWEWRGARRPTSGCKARQNAFDRTLAISAVFLGRHVTKESSTDLLGRSRTQTAAIGTSRSCTERFSRSRLFCDSV
jgi:hypothetical protein